MMDWLIILTWMFPILSVILLCFVAAIFATSESIPKIHVYESEKTFPSNEGRETFPSLDDEPSCDLTVVVPAYNEEKRLPKMLQECTAYLDQNGGHFEIIIVDDGSKDSTSETVIQWSQRLGSNKLRLLKLEKNLGKGGAVRRGMLVSRGKHLLFADADGATTFSELAKMTSLMAKIENEEGHGVICGSRAHLEADSIANRSLFRTILMYGFHLCVKIFGCRTIHDTQCGFKLFTRRTARIMFRSCHIERWAFDVELLKIGEMLKIPMAEVAVQWTEIEGSKLNPLLASIQMFKDLFFLWLRYAVGAWKIVEKID